jgi:hypothetical protein
MKTKNTSFMAGLLIFGIIGASDSIAAAPIETQISGANAAKITRINEIQKINIDEIGINESGIDSIAIRTIIARDILDDHIDAGIAQIAA